MPYPTPTPLVADLVERLEPELRQDFEERAGIIEFDGGQPRDLAECLALIDVLRRFPGALIGVAAVRLETAGESHILLTANPNAGFDLAARKGGVVKGILDLQAAVNELGGICVLSEFHDSSNGESP